LSGKLKKLRKGFPIKILFFLTADWDILLGGLAVAIVDVIDALMYRALFAFLGRMNNMIAIFNN
jgi:hypothetical protein